MANFPKSDEKTPKREPSGPFEVLKTPKIPLPTLGQDQKPKKGLECAPFYQKNQKSTCQGKKKTQVKEGGELEPAVWPNGKYIYSNELF